MLASFQFLVSLLWAQAYSICQRPHSIVEDQQVLGLANAGRVSSRCSNRVGPGTFGKPWKVSVPSYTWQHVATFKTSNHCSM